MMKHEYPPLNDHLSDIFFLPDGTEKDELLEQAFLILWQDLRDVSFDNAAQAQWYLDHLPSDASFSIRARIHGACGLMRNKRLDRESRILGIKQVREWLDELSRETQEPLALISASDAYNVALADLVTELHEALVVSEKREDHLRRIIVADLEQAEAEFMKQKEGIYHVRHPR